ncbi:MAG: hypothetical protein J6D57_05835 [Mogibacterium sp.]|nr:hypothetical protein [Mogibacterium sp.]
MKKIVAINCSPRTVWNTATLVKDAAEGAKEKGACTRFGDGVMVRTLCADLVLNCVMQMA